MHDAVSRVLEQKQQPLVTVTPQTPIGEAIARMNDRCIGSVLVMEGERLAGIFTERDVLMRVVPKRLDPQKTPVGEVMTREVLTISPSRTVGEAMMIMTDTKRRHIPVVEGPKVIGMISIGDLTRWMVRDQQRTIDELIDYVRRG